MSRDRWRPLRTNVKIRPEKGKLIAYRHAVWRVARVEDVPLAELDEAARDVWFDRGMPELSTWPDRPYRVVVDWVGGALPPWHQDGDKQTRGTVSVPSTAHILWRVYPSDRWPQCSCCGEPMPCRAEMEDEQVTASLDRIAKMEAIPPSACWACSEPITTRQKAVTYPGENLDLPGADAPNFHTRRSCLSAAHAYEERWVAVDPRRERILTWPLCGGSLIVHGDGSSECFGGVLDCHGHATHDHQSFQACYTQSHGCPRECPREDHPGTRPAPRPARRDPTAGGLLARLVDNAQTRAAIPLADLPEPTDDELDRLISQARVLSGDKVEKHLDEVSRLLHKIHRTLVMDVVPYHQQLRAAGKGDDATAIQKRSQLAGSVNELVAAYRGLNKSIREEMKP